MAEDRFWAGETIRVDVDFTDDAGQPMVALGVSIKAKRPDGVVIDASVQEDGTGAYFAVIVLEPAGVWAVRASCTGPTPAVAETRFTAVASYVL